MIFATKREALKMKQEDVATVLGVDRTTVSKWETGINLPRSDLLPKIATLYDCTVDELLADSKTDKKVEFQCQEQEK